MRARRPKKPTVTSLVAEYLRKLDDFADHRMICSETGADSAHVSAALIHLRAHRVVDVVVEPSGKGWWFALPPESDNRLRTFSEIADGVRRPNRKTAKKKGAL